jgi:hypothetical protein
MAHLGESATKALDWARRNSLWLAGFGLMLASSGLDGVYMAKWMPGGLGWLGWTLNTTSDVSGLVLMYWFGRLQQGGKIKRRLSWALLPAEIVAVGYSWFFGWRQLSAVMPSVESEASTWVAPIAAGFIPLLLAFVGYAQSLLAGKLDTPKPNQERTETHRNTTDVHRADVFTCPVCGRLFGSQNGLNSHVGKMHGNGHKVEIETVEHTAQ